MLNLIKVAISSLVAQSRTRSKSDKAVSESDPKADVESNFLIQTDTNFGYGIGFGYFWIFVGSANLTEHTSGGTTEF